MLLWIWLVVAVAAALGEVVTYDLFLASVAGAALVTAGVSGFLPLALQIAVFSVLSLVGIFVVRPAVKQALGIDSSSGEPAVARHTHLINRKAVVTQAVSIDGGQIRVGQGEFWTARTLSPEDYLEAGAAVRVVTVDGLTAVVEPLEQQLEQNPPSQISGMIGKKGT